MILRVYYLFGLRHDIRSMFHQKFHDHSVLFGEMEQAFLDLSAVMQGTFAFPIGTADESLAFLFATQFGMMEQFFYNGVVTFPAGFV